MNVKVEKTEKNIVTLEIEVAKEIFEEGMEKAYRKNVKSIALPGFRKGKAPRKFIEKYYGEAVFYEDAINFVCPDAYDKAIEENGIAPVAQPEIDIVQIGNGENFIFKATVTVKPEFEIGEYKGIKVDKIEYIPTDDDIQAELSRMQEQNARIITVEDRSVENGDIVTIDYEGFVDGTAFDGGADKNHDLTIGSGQFIPGFEEQLIGKASGEECEINVTFPAEYHAEELKGKDATFKVTIHSIKKKELPALDDEFAKDISEFDTFDALRADVIDQLTKSGETRALRETEEKIMEAIANATEIDIPRPMIETQIDRMMDDFRYRLSSSGLTLEQYAEYTGMPLTEMRKQYEENAQRAVKGSLILEKIAEIEKIEASEEEIESELQKMADSYKMELDKIKKIMGENTEGIASDIKTNKTLDFLVKNAEIKKARKKAAPKTTDAETAEEAAPAKKTTTKKTTTKANTTEKKSTATKTKTASAAKSTSEKKTTTKKDADAAPAKKTAAKKTDK
ncbi:MAG: trigger factor [Ruminococcaceae bacterium]|nr:trigger factor [Oscillospiraceae bacterium]